MMVVRENNVRVKCMQGLLAASATSASAGGHRAADMMLRARGGSGLGAEAMVKTAAMMASASASLIAAKDQEIETLRGLLAAAKQASPPPSSSTGGSEYGSDGELSAVSVLEEAERELLSAVRSEARAVHTIFTGLDQIPFALSKSGVFIFKRIVGALGGHHAVRQGGERQQ